MIFDVNRSRIGVGFCNFGAGLKSESQKSDSGHFCDRPPTAKSSVPNDLSPLTPACCLGQQLAPNTPVGAFHNTGDLRRDYHYNATLAPKFWLCWVKGFLPTLQGTNKWRVTQENLFVGQLVLVGDADDISKRGAYRLGRVHRIHPQMYIRTRDCSQSYYCSVKKFGLWCYRICFEGYFQDCSHLVTVCLLCLCAK